MTEDELEKATASRELSWLLTTLTETLTAVRSGLQECLSLLDPSGPHSTLALSSSRSESLKGIVSRSGPKITRADMHLKMHGLPRGYKISLASDGGPPSQELVLEQLVDVKNCVLKSMELLAPRKMGKKMAVREGGGGEDAGAVLGRLRELKEYVDAARTALKGQSTHRLFPFYGVDSEVFDPPLPNTAAVNLYISEAALVAEIRTFENLAPAYDPSKPSGFSLPVPSSGVSSPFGFRERFAAAVGFKTHHESHAPPPLDPTRSGNVGEIYDYKGERVRVRDIVKVESQDPNLMAVWAKLGGVEHIISGAVKGLEVVMTAAGIKC